MKDRTEQHILLVDEDKHLDDLYRSLRKTYSIYRARGGEQGLHLLEREGPFAVVIADYDMRGMDADTFLDRVGVLSSDTVRVMLVAAEDYETAIEALNRGRIFCFLERGCSSDLFAASLKRALEQHELVRTNRTLVEQTIRCNIQVLSDMLCLANPEAFGRGARIQSHVRYVADRLDLSPDWLYESLGLLSQVGCVTIPQDVLARLARGEKLSDAEKKMLDRHAQVGYRILKRIPGMEEAAEMVFHQRGMDAFAEKQATEAVKVGSQILAAAVGFEDLLSAGNDKGAVVEALRRRNVCSQEVLSFLARVVSTARKLSFRALKTAELTVGMILDQDVITDDGSLLITRGEEITPAVRERLIRYAEGGSISEPIHVRIAATPSGVTGARKP